MPQITYLNPNDGPNGFVWKPISDSDNNLVILLPPVFNHRAVSVEVHDTDIIAPATLIESGEYTGIANGNRTHWRYNRPGAAFGADVYAVVWMKTDELFIYAIGDGANRYD